MAPVCCRQNVVTAASLTTTAFCDRFAQLGGAFVSVERGVFVSQARDLLALATLYIRHSKKLKPSNGEPSLEEGRRTLEEAKAILEAVDPAAGQQRPAQAAGPE
eukprot:COSAG01_NODE_6784_length_3499_cov_4.194706_2_plen_104_part_00